MSSPRELYRQSTNKSVNFVAYTLYIQADKMYTCYLYSIFIGFTKYLSFGDKKNKPVKNI